MRHTVKRFKMLFVEVLICWQQFKRSCLIANFARRSLSMGEGGLYSEVKDGNQICQLNNFNQTHAISHTSQKSHNWAEFVICSIQGPRESEGWEQWEPVTNKGPWAQLQSPALALLKWVCTQEWCLLLWFQRVSQIPTVLAQINH